MEFMPQILVLHIALNILHKIYQITESFKKTYQT